VSRNTDWRQSSIRSGRRRAFGHHIRSCLINSLRIARHHTNVTTRFAWLKEIRYSTVRHRRNERFPLLWTVQSRTLELCNESIERPHNVAFTDEVKPTHWCHRNHIVRFWPVFFAMNRFVGNPLLTRVHVSATVGASHWSLSFRRTSRTTAPSGYVRR
jgi:hypothetical protein